MLLSTFYIRFPSLLVKLSRVVSVVKTLIDSIGIISNALFYSVNSVVTLPRD